MNKEQNTIKFTKDRIITCAQLNVKMAKVARDYYGRQLSQQELDCISVMAEEVAINLPEGTRLSRVNQMTTEEILEYIRLQKEKEDNTLAERCRRIFNSKWFWISWSIAVATLTVIIMHNHGLLS